MSRADPMLTTAEAAARLGLAPKTLRNWRTNGRGPVATKLGAAVRYRQSAIDRFARVNEQDRTPMPERRRAS